MWAALGVAPLSTAPLGAAAPMTRALAALSWNYLTLFLARSLEHAFSSVSVLGFWALGQPVGWHGSCTSLSASRQCRPSLLTAMVAPTPTVRAFDVNGRPHHQIVSFVGVFGLCAISCSLLLGFVVRSAVCPCDAAYPSSGKPCEKPRSYDRQNLPASRQVSITLGGRSLANSVSNLAGEGQVCR